MISPPDTSVTAGNEGGAIAYGGVAVLMIPVEWMEFCYHCQEEHRFVANEDCAAGLIARCANCWHERIAPFTRTIAEVA